MKTDRYTKVVLTVIAILLGIIAFGRSSPNRAQAQADPSGPRTKHVLMSLGPDGMLVYDTRWGDFALYDVLRRSDGDRVLPRLKGTALSVGGPIVLGDFAGLSSPPATQPAR